MVSEVEFPDVSLLERAVAESGSNFRLNQFLKKCQSREQVRIGFIGGSITQGALASPESARYSSRLCQFLEKSFPNTKVVELNAGIGATNSRFGCSRFHDDLLVNKPDMIVIEFAVNDDLDDTTTSAATIEGLIRQSLQDTDVPVLLFHTMNKNGNNINQAIQTRIARHYSLPVVSYRNACWPLVESGALLWNELSPDDVHPNTDGHLIGSYLLYKFIREEALALEKSADEYSAIPQCLFSDLYQHAGIFKSGDTLLAVSANEGWEMFQDGKRTYNFISDSQGDKMTIKTLARELCATFLFSKDLNSDVQILVDGHPVDTLSNFFPDDLGGGYLKTKLIFRYPDIRERAIQFINLTGGKFDLRYVLYAE